MIRLRAWRAVADVKSVAHDPHNGALTWRAVAYLVWDDTGERIPGSPSETRDATGPSAAALAAHNALRQTITATGYQP